MAAKNTEIASLKKQLTAAKAATKAAPRPAVVTAADACGDVQTKLDAANAALEAVNRRLLAVQQELNVTRGLLASTQDSLDTANARLMRSQEAEGEAAVGLGAGAVWRELAAWAGGWLSSQAGTPCPDPNAHASRAPCQTERRPAPSNPSLPSPALTAGKAKADLSNARAEAEDAKAEAEAWKLSVDDAESRARLLQEGIDECNADRRTVTCERGRGEMGLAAGRLCEVSPCLASYGRKAACLRQQHQRRMPPTAPPSLLFCPLATPPTLARAFSSPDPPAAADLADCGNQLVDAQLAEAAANNSRGECETDLQLLKDTCGDCTKQVATGRR